LSGSYTVGGEGATYSTIDDAISALVNDGVSGPVVFLIGDGTYAPPRGGYTLPPLGSMSGTNTVTFKPASGASVLLSGGAENGVFQITGHDYILDGSNSDGGSTQDWQIVNENTDYSVIMLSDGANHNTIENLHLVGGSYDMSQAIVSLQPDNTGASGTSNNTIASNTLGDLSGAMRPSAAIFMYGQTGSSTNTGNRIEKNDIVNLGNETNTAFAIYVGSGNQSTSIVGNRIHIPNKDGFSGDSYGIAFDNQDNSDLDVIADNTIWDLSSSNPSAYQSAIAAYPTNGSTLTIHDNMISLSGNNGTLVGMELGSNGGTVDVDYNSIYIAGANRNETYSYGMYVDGSTVASMMNNIVFNARTSSGTGTNVGIYAVSGATLTSDHNLLYAWGPSTAVGFDGSNTQTTLADWQTTGQDANSVTSNPHFTDPAGGDLHISGTLHTPVEGRGTAITGLDADIDGDSRSATTPDIGADEGSFLDLVTDDLETMQIDMPVDGQFIRSSSAFTPSAVVTNVGTTAESGVTVGIRITDRGTGNVVYEDAQTTGAIAVFGTEPITFSTTGSVTGSTSLTPGDYTYVVWTDLGTDGNRGNDSLSGSFTVKDPLNGIYTIDQNGSGSTNYPSFTDAVRDLNEVGISGTVTFRIAAGTYDAGIETFPLVIGAIDGADASTTVTFVPASGASPVVAGQGADPIFELSGASYVHFDGSNGDSREASRDWTVANTGEGPVIVLDNGAQHNSIENMYVYGAPNSALIGIGQDLAGVGGTSDNRIASNTLGDESGRFRAAAGVYMYGASGSGSTNSSNTVEGNDIINFGADIYTGYGIYVDIGNAMTKLIGNTIHAPVKDGSGGSVEGIRFANTDDSDLDSIAYNKIWDLTTNTPTSALAGITVYGQAGGSSLTIHDNMISLVAESGTLSGILIRSSDGATAIYNNSVYIGGDNSSSSTQSFNFRAYPNTNVTLKNNVLVNMRSSTGTNTNRVFYRNNANATVTSDYNLLYAGASSGVLAYDDGNYYSDLASWQATGNDANSRSASIEFADALNGDLHIPLRPVFVGESAGTPIAGEGDFDGDARDASMPDIGADEGNFNGGGITVASPNGDEYLVANFHGTARFRTNRPLGVQVELSTDNGATWSVIGSVDRTVTGENEITFDTPDVVTDEALIRVTSTLNEFETDASDATFHLVRPVVTVTAANGGERWVAGDEMAIQWTSENVPPTLLVSLEYSTDDGSTWNPIASDLASANLPSGNSYNWVVPNTPTDHAKIRVEVPGMPVADESNTSFTILEQPSVTLTAPTAGARWYAGDKDTIRWTSTTTDNVTIEYSLNGGATWTELAHHVPSYIANFPWTVPNTTTTNAIVRITDFERPRYVGESGEFSILRSQITVMAPNGGEGYELNEPVTVTWTSSDVAHVRVEYSADNGVTWQAVASGIDASAGTATFTPPAVPTKTARVRVVDEDRPISRDLSDGAFEILQPKSITLFTPATGDGFARNSTATIYWRSVRVSILNIYYSSNGGSTWDLVAANVPAPNGTYAWTVPNQNTENGKIRLTEVLGDLVVESGRFSIVDPATPTLRLISPNGGETYTVGDIATISWYASGISTPLTVSYSSDGGSSWSVIASNVSPSAGSILWNVATTPASTYRIKIAGGSVSDVSDANFAINAQPNPSLRVTSPNGGESYTVGTTQTITWTAQDVFGTFALQYSTDDGNTWKDITTVPANASGSGNYSSSWTIPNDVTSLARVRVMGSTAVDASDAPFEIKAKVLQPIVVTSPNGGEKWKAGDSHRITWTAPNDIANVKIDYSIDGGTSWVNVVGTTPNNGSYDWTLPNVTATTTTALVRVYDVTDGTRSDVSDAVFEIDPKVTGSIHVVTPNGGETINGASHYQVTFTAPLDVANVWVYYSSDNGATWQPVAGPLAATTGSYTWLVPNVGTTKGLIRVSDAADASRKDESDATFTISEQSSGVELSDAVTGAQGVMVIGNFPNPFATSTQIRWTQGTGGRATLRLFREDGTIAGNLELGYHEAGTQSFELQAGDLASGVYRYEIRVGDKVAHGAMLITR
jgi:hypothetical protein